jgi:hypothetical protein
MFRVIVRHRTYAPMLGRGSAAFCSARMGLLDRGEMAKDGALGALGCEWNDLWKGYMRCGY